MSIECFDKSRLKYQAERVNDVDKYLKDRWEIDLLPSGKNPAETLKDRGQKEESLAVLTAFKKAKNKFQAGTNTLEAEKELYELMAHQPYLGVLTSSRRAEVLDSICLAISLIEEFNLSGPVLDVGTHAGFLPAALARHIDNDIFGIDPCERAIEVAKIMAANESVSYSTNTLEEISGSFDLICAVNATPQHPSKTASFLRNVSRRLTANGVAMLVAAHWVDYDIGLLRRQTERAGLGYCFADVVGGWTGSDYQSTGLLVLSRESKTTIPRKLRSEMESLWNSFAEFASSVDTDRRMKTQSYHRSRTSSVVTI